METLFTTLHKPHLVTSFIWFLYGRIVYPSNFANTFLYLRSLNILRLQTLEGGNLHELGEGVELLAGLLVVVALAAQADAYAGGGLADAGGPNVLVELGVNTDVLGSHGFFGEFLDGLDCAGSALLECRLMNHFGKMDGVIPGDEVGLGLALLAVSGGHFDLVFYSSLKVR